MNYPHGAHARVETHLIEGAMIQCPSCHGLEIFRSRRSLPWYLVPFGPLVIKLRCHVCGRKFYYFRPLAWGVRFPDEDEEDELE